MSTTEPAPASTPDTTPWLPLSVNARGIYLAAAIDPTNPCYNTAELLECPVGTNLDTLRQALRHLYEENEGFRVRTRLHAGRAEQQVLGLDEFLENTEFLENIELLPVPENPHEEEPDSEPVPAMVRAWASSLIAEPLNPDAGITVRSRVAFYADRLWVYHSFHHVVADGFAAFNGLSRIASIYRALSSGHSVPPVSRASLAELIAADNAAEPARASDYEYWTAGEGATALEQPDTSLAARTAAPAPRALRASLPIPNTVQQNMLAAAKKYGASWPVAATAAIGAYLGRIGGYDTAAFGIPQMNRMFGPTLLEPTRALGKTSANTGTTAVNVLPVQVPSLGSIAAALSSVKDQFARNTQHPLARQEDLERAAARNDSRLFGAQINIVPFDAVLTLGVPTPGTDELPGAPAPVARIHNVSAGPVADMTVTLRGMPGRGNPIYLELDANPNLYTMEQVQAHARHMGAWLENWATAATNELPLEAITTALPTELETINAFNSTGHHIEYKTLLQRFTDAVAAHPNEPALIAAAPGERYTLTPESPHAHEFNHTLTYAQLDARSRALAASLVAAGVRPGTAVGLRFNRGIEQYIAVYAALYAGAIYVPILPELPAERVGHMLTDAGCSALLNGPGLGLLAPAELSPENPERFTNLPQLPFTALTPTAQHPLPADTAPASAILPGHETELDDTAYILFTSGSTGRPKGVAVSHRAIDNRLRWQQSKIPVAPGDRVLHKTPISFDVHVWELYWPLQEGAAVVIAAPEGHRDPEYLARVTAEQDITCVHFVPTMLAAFITSPTARRVLKSAGFGPQETDRRLRYLVCSGEALQKDQVLGAHRVLGAYPLNLYGPTEAAVDVTFWDTAEDPEREIIPIGEPVWNTGTHILDRAGRPVPPGITGELYLSGVQLAQGYVNNPQATASAFGQDAPSGMRVYRTGDLAAWEILPGAADDKPPRGVIVYRGRSDNQVKLRGQRLELGDIETVLTSLHSVTSAVALLYTGLREPALAAFLEVGALSTEQREEIIADARRACERNLPDYMVPSLWHAMETLPVSASGKADRKQLAQFRFATATADARGPHGLLEQQLCTIFARVLGRERFGTTEDFFAAGGHSLAALEVIAAIGEQLGLSVSIGALFANPTVEGLTRALEQDAGLEFAPVLPLRAADAELTPDTPAPLFVLPPAGGLGWCYAGYLAYLPANQPVYAVQASAFSDPHAGFPSTLRELAQEYLGRIRQTLRDANLPARIELMGWSVGGTAAVEVAALAEDTGIAVERTVLLDAYPAEQWQGVPAPDEQESFRALLRMGGMPEAAPGEVLDLPGTLKRLRQAGSAMGHLPEDKLGVCLKSMRASAALMRGARQLDFSGAVTMFAVPHEDQPYLDAHGWESHAGALRVVWVDGTHPDLVNPAYIPQIVAEVFGSGSAE